MRYLLPKQIHMSLFHEMCKKNNADAVIVGDGGKGHILSRFALGNVDPGQPENVIFSNQRSVEALLTAFAQAGSDWIQSTSFSFNEITRPKMSKRDLRTANIRAMSIAGRVADRHHILVGASIGPIGSELYVGKSKIQDEDGIRAYEHQMRWLLSGKRKPDFFMLETINHLHTAELAKVAHDRVMRDTRLHIPMTLSMIYNYWPDSGKFTTISGCTPTRSVQFVDEHPNTYIAVGANCGPKNVLPIDLLTRAFKTLNPSVPIIMKPNAGTPDERGGYSLANVVDARIIAQQARSEGARVVGGCCGFHPNEIRAMAEELKN
jgi:methionine synthase / methylenetetrahydrofolate reductase(NADPH)